MNINQKAVQLLEENKLDESFELLQEAVKISRDVQSLTNLAWFYCYEEDDDAKAVDLLKEAVSMNPSSHFPYNLLGEIYSRQEMWNDAKDLLLQANSISASKTAYHNLAVANYHLGNVEDASKYFLLASGHSDDSLYNHVKCLIEFGNIHEAKMKLDAFSEYDDDFVGEVEVADLYVELGCYKEAIEWFEKGWNMYFKEPSWISRYVYSLLNLNDLTRAHEVLNQSINQKIEEIIQANEDDCDEDWIESDKQTYIKKLMDEKNEYEQMVERIASGYIPKMEFDLSIKTACYLFGCNRHNHPEYQE